MKIEKHNSHGLQLAVSLSTEEAEALIIKLMATLLLARKTDVSRYVSTPCLFEDDNNRWEKTDFTVVVEGTSFRRESQPTFPCGKEIVQGAANSAPEFCNQQEGHDNGCYRL